MEKDLTVKIGYIYKLISPNNKIYVGQTLNHYKRKSDYKYNKFDQQIKLWNNCKFYNWNPSDSFEVIEECLCGFNKEYLNEREKYWIKYYDSFKNGLNCNEGGSGNVGHTHSLKTRKKISDAKKGFKHSEEAKCKIGKSSLGRSKTKEVREKMSKTKRERMNNEIKNKIRIGLKGNKNGIGNKGVPKRIICLTNGVVYESIISAARELKLHDSNIIQVCKGKCKQTGGYVFKYYE